MFLDTPLESLPDRHEVDGLFRLWKPEEAGEDQPISEPERGLLMPVNSASWREEPVLVGGVDGAGLERDLDVLLVVDGLLFMEGPQGKRDRLYEHSTKSPLSERYVHRILYHTLSEFSPGAVDVFEQMPDMEWVRLAMQVTMCKLMALRMAELLVRVRQPVRPYFWGKMSVGDGSLEVGVKPVVHRHARSVTSTDLNRGVISAEDGRLASVRELREGNYVEFGVQVGRHEFHGWSINSVDLDYLRTIVPPDRFDRLIKEDLVRNRFFSNHGGVRLWTSAELRRMVNPFRTSDPHDIRTFRALVPH